MLLSSAQQARCTPSLYQQGLSHKHTFSSWVPNVMIESTETREAWNHIQVTWLLRTCWASSRRAFWRLSCNNEKSPQPWLGGYKIRPLWLSSKSKSAASKQCVKLSGQGPRVWILKKLGDISKNFSITSREQKAALKESSKGAGSIYTLCWCNWIQFDAMTCNDYSWCHMS